MGLFSLICHIALEILKGAIYRLCNRLFPSHSFQNDNQLRHWRGMKERVEPKSLICGGGLTFQADYVLEGSVPPVTQACSIYEIKPFVSDYFLMYMRPKLKAVGGDCSYVAESGNHCERFRDNVQNIFSLFFPSLISCIKSKELCYASPHRVAVLNF